MAVKLLTFLTKTAVLVVLILTVFVLVAAVDVYAFSRRDETRPADAAIVLGAAAWGDRPSPVFRERINHALWLYEQGYVTVIIFTGGQGVRGNAPEAEVARQYALARGLPAEVILTEDTSTNTWQNLRQAQALAQVRDLESFLIVSTPYHMKRAMAIAADLGMEAYSSPTRTTRWINWYTQTRAYTREVAGYVVYQLDRGVMGEWASGYGE